MYARRYVELDQTLGLVVGGTHCLVIDTGTDEVHGASMAAAVRFVTPLPWTVVITHAHFDHFFGTDAFLPCVGDRARAAAGTVILRGDGEHAAAGLVGDCFRSTRARREQADRLAAAQVVVAPTEVITVRCSLDLGGRRRTLVHPGPAHTDHDVFVHVPDAQVVFAGDLVEQGAPPSVGPDSAPVRLAVRRSTRSSR